MKFYGKILIIVAVVHLSFMANAQTLPTGRDAAVNKTLTSNTVMLEVGSAHRADTYLTPLHYGGWMLKLAYNHERHFKNQPLFWALDISLQADRTMNRARNSVLWGAQFECRWSMSRQWDITPSVKVSAGGATTLDAGALYMRRNGNNPVAANASWTADVTAGVSWRFHLGLVPVEAQYKGTLPVIGAMFAPEYGQLYYEIYLGDRKGIFTGAWWGKYFRLDNLVSVDIKLGPKYLRLGYAFDVLSTKAHDIVSRRINHAAVIGVRW